MPTDSLIPNPSGILSIQIGREPLLVTQIKMIGTYTSANFSATSDGQGKVEIFDPAVVSGGSVEPGASGTYPREGIDLPTIAFGAQTTLAY